MNEDKDIVAEVAGLKASFRGHEKLDDLRFMLFCALVSVAATIALGAGGWAFAQVHADQEVQANRLQQVLERLPPLSRRPDPA